MIIIVNFLVLIKEKNIIIRIAILFAINSILVSKLSIRLIITKQFNVHLIRFSYLQVQLNTRLKVFPPCSLIFEVENRICKMEINVSI